MRILYLHQYFKTPDSPGGTRSYEMGRRLAAAGHTVHVITSETEDRRFWPRWRVSEEAGMFVHRVQVPYSNRMGHLRRIWAFVAFALWASVRATRTPADVVFATSTPLTIAIPGRVAAALHRIPFVFEVRDLWPDVPIALGALRGPIATWAARALERWAYRGAVRIVTLAPGMKRHIVSTGYPESRVTLVPNACDRALFADDECAARVRAAHDWLGDRPLVVYAGTLGLVNGVEWLVEVAAEAAAIDPDIRFAVVGGGREHEAVERRARELGVLGVNLHLIGEIPKRETACWVRASSAAISLIIDRDYLWENAVTNKFFDALAAGRPILSNHPGYQTEIAVEAGAGAMLDPADHAKAARQLVGLLRDTEWLTRASRASALLAEERFDRDLLTARLERVLVEAVEGAGR